MNFKAPKMLKGLAIVISLLTASVVLAGTRYVVTIKSGSAYSNVMSQVKDLQTMSAQGEGAGLFGTSAEVTSTLDAIEMLVIETNNQEDIEAIKARGDVLAVDQEIFFEAPKMDKVSVQYNSYGYQNTFSIEVPWGIRAVKAPEAWASANYGIGARVAVLDTGIDKDHVDLASRFEQGRNFFPDNNPGPYDFFDLVGHGTHVAGTIAADGNNSGLVGVAPGAAILAGRVCGTRGCSSIAILEGVNWGVQQGVDVISMSLGGPFPPSQTIAYDRAHKANVVVVAAAGNDGSGRLSFPAGLPTVISVGAVDSSLKRAEFSQYGKGLDITAPGVDVNSSVPTGSGREALVEVDFGKGLTAVKSTPFQGSSEAVTPLAGDLVYAGLGKPGDFVNDVKGKIALISRGEISFVDKVNEALKHGAVGVVIFNNEPGLIHGGLTNDGSTVGVPVVMIEQQIGVALANNLNRGFSQTARISTVQTSHSAMSGTSMACPHISGVVALMKAVNKNLTVEEVRTILKQTAVNLGSANEYGAGIVNAEAAVYSSAFYSNYQVAN